MKHTSATTSCACTSTVVRDKLSVLGQELTHSLSSATGMGESMPFRSACGTETITWYKGGLLHSVCNDVREIISTLWLIQLASWLWVVVTYWYTKAWHEFKDYFVSQFLTGQQTSHTTSVSTYLINYEGTQACIQAVTVDCCPVNYVITKLIILLMFQFC